MNFIEGVALSNLCDFSFGDVEGIIHGIVGTVCVKVGDDSFLNFINTCEKDVVTVFIGNSRIGELLDYLKKFNKKFIIFCNLEDTPITSNLHKLIPENVLSINSSNATAYGGKIFALPYGLQRKLKPDDNRIEILKNNYDSKDVPEKLLYVNHSVETNHGSRFGINELFQDYIWATVRNKRTDYTTYLQEIKNHKFMICPVGHAIDCHRNWEVLYMRRVPVMLRYEYLINLFKDYPVLFVNTWHEVTEDLLLDNNKLYDDIQSMSLDNLDIFNMYNKCVDRHYD